ncbi:MAG: helix-turn-helix transcriptional regulator [Thermoplasmata archaeon]|nr:helix-turn-helix transcriptional regulator [Thermoplasmata archaeon]
MRKDVLERAVLRALHGKELHGYAIQRELTSAGFNVEVGNLYRVLRSMEVQAQVRSRWSESHRGPRKRVYAVGPEGRRRREIMLREAIFTVLQEYADYLTAHVAPQTEDLEGTIVVVTSPFFDPVRQTVLRRISSRLVRGRLYLVKPPQVSFEYDHRKVTILDGSHVHIPIEDGSATGVIFNDIPSGAEMEQALDEATRVLDPKGWLSIATLFPTRPAEDPAPLSVYLFRLMATLFGNIPSVDPEELERRLRERFRSVHRVALADESVFNAWDLRPPRLARRSKGTVDPARPATTRPK